ncbi:MAG: M48 family metalloprotease [Achromobacter sp.]
MSSRRVITSIVSLTLLAPLLPLNSASAQPVGVPTIGAASTAELSPALEDQLGAAIMAQGRRDPTFIDDTEVNQYLTTMGRKLAGFAAGSVPDVTLFAVRDPEINAFALPGGYIGVHSGLVVASRSESELAGVVAHEIGHVVQRHVARGMTQQKQSGAVMMGAMAAALLAALAGGGGNLAIGVAAFGQAAAINRQLGFSRDAEREADRAGFQMMTKAGYDPAGMVSMFSLLMNASRLNEGAGGGAWASTHPLSIDRMSDIQNRSREMTSTRYLDSDDYAYIRAKLRVLQGRDTTSQRSTEQQLRDEVRALTGVRQSAAYYGLALIALQRNRPDESQSLWQEASAGGRSVPALAQLQVDILLARKDTAGAVSAAAAAYKRWPQRRALAMAYAQALSRNGQEVQARDFLRERIKQWPNDEPDLYRLLAQSEQRSGNDVAARRSMARFYAMTGALPAAESQLQQARNMTQDFYEQSQIDVQIRELKDKMADERQLLERFKG